MLVRRYAPSDELDDGKVIEYGQVYTVRAIRFSKHTGVIFELDGFQIENSNEFHSFIANHFRTPNGKRSDIVRALPNTQAYDVHKNRLLYLEGFEVVDGVEMVILRDYRSAFLHQKQMPYSEFTHE